LLVSYGGEIKNEMLSSKRYMRQKP